jgi:alpha-tubulin suppressor-like RCC1 family protein
MAGTSISEFSVSLYAFQDYRMRSLGVVVRATILVSVSVVVNGINYGSSWYNPFAMVAVRQDGTVASWGLSSNGGTGGTVPDVNNVKEIFSSNNMFAALRHDGTVQDWGTNPSGVASAPLPSGLGNVQTIYANM